MGKCAMRSLTKIWKDRGISKATKATLISVLVFPIVTYGSESWTIRKAERKRLDSFELWCWRRVLNISWIQRRTNRWVLETIQPKEPLEASIVRGKLRYFGHVCRSIGSMEHDILFGRVEGQRRRGRPRIRWIDGVLDTLGDSLSAVVRRTSERDNWRTHIMRVTRGRTRLDGTR